MGNARSKLYPKSKAKKRSSKKEKAVLPESSTAQKTVDPRLPFTTYRQVFNLRNSWKAISRNLEDTSKTNLILFFEKYPNYQELFPKLKDLKTEEQMKDNMAFENQAVAIYTVFDETMEHIESLDKAMHGIKMAAQAHSSIPGFDSKFFTDMEETFIEAGRQTLGERFTESTEDNFRKLYTFVIGCMTNELKS